MKKLFATLLFMVIIIRSSVFCDGMHISLFQQNAIAYDSEMFSATDAFLIIGAVTVDKHIIYCAYNQSVWGSSKRMTGRLLLFKEDGTFIGMYGGINVATDWITLIDSKIIFSWKEEYWIEKHGNVIDFTNGIPRSIWIFGHSYEYEEIAPLRSKK